MRKIKKLTAFVTALSISASLFAGFASIASADGETADAATISYADGKITATYKAGEKARMIVAKYNTNDTLKSISVPEEITFDANGKAEVTKTLDTGDTVFLWDSVEGMIPLLKEAYVQPSPTPVTREYETIFSQDYESYADTAALKADLKADWKSANYLDGLTLATDKTKYAQYLLGTNVNTRTATCTFSTPIDLLAQDKYAVEFDLALKKSTLEDVQFVIASGTIPTANAAFSSNDYIFKTTMAGATNNCKLNDIDSAAVTLADGAWYHYELLVDKDESLITLTVTNDAGEKAIDKLLIPTSGVNDKITGLFICSGRYNSCTKIDNLLVRTTDKYDEFAEKEREQLTRIDFVSQLNKTITQPAENAPVHEKIQVKAMGNYGGDLSNEEDIDIKWDVIGLDGEDGYISLTKEEGSESGTVGVNPDGSPVSYFNVRNGVSNWFGAVKATVTYLDKTLEIMTPFAVIGASGGTNIAPVAGYPENMSDYDDSLVGYKALANGITDKDLVLNNWSIYGSNGKRTLTLKQDEDDTKYLEFASNGGSGSTVAVYQLADQTNQYIVDMKVRFRGGNMSFGHYANTPNNGDSNPNWTCSFSSGTLTVGTQSISGLNTEDWYRVVVSADESAGTYWVKVFNSTGTLVGQAEGESLDVSNAKKIESRVAVDIDPITPSWKVDQKYFCFMGSFPVDLASFKIYYPTPASLAITADTETIQVPEAAGTPAKANLSAILKDTDGWNMTGKITWSLDEEYAGVTINENTGVISVDNTAGSGTITAVASYGAQRAEKQLMLSTTGNSMTFTKSVSSVTIPFEGEEAVEAEYAAEARNKDGQAIPGATVTYSMVDANNQPVTLNGVTFNPATGKLTVTSEASSKVVYIRAVSEVSDGASGTETLTSRAKVNIHGLSFAFGSNEPADETEGFTQVLASDAYTEKIGYGFADTSVVTTEAADVKGTDAYRFKAKVPNGNYVVNVTTSSAAMKSEVVESVPATTGISKSGASFKVAVCDGVLDLTFDSASTLSKLTITQDAAKSELAKPAVYAIGDSTTNNNNDGALSWGNYAANHAAELKGETFSSFSNNGFAGRDSVNFYNQGRVEAVLLAICPGDYVTVNMGINSKEPGEGASYETLVSEYYVQGIIDRGAIPVIVTATPLGFSDKAYPYDNATGKFTNNRGDGARNDVLRRIAKTKGLNLIELGQAGEDWLNNSTLDELKAYGDTTPSAADKLTLVKSWYTDHNHYKEPMAKWISEYLFGKLNEIVEDPYKYVPEAE